MKKINVKLYNNYNMNDYYITLFQKQLFAQLPIIWEEIVRFSKFLDTVENWNN